MPEVVFLNTSGGLTGGDVLNLSLDLGDGVRLTATTQTAERAYASTQGEACVRLRPPSARAAGWTGCRRKRSCLNPPTCHATRRLI